VSNTTFSYFSNIHRGVPVSQFVSISELKSLEIGGVNMGDALWAVVDLTAPKNSQELQSLDYVGLYGLENSSENDKVC